MIHVLAIMIGVLLGNGLYYGIGHLARRRRVHSSHVKITCYGKLTDTEKAALKHSIDKLA